MSLLVLGGTGTLGRQIVKRALDEGFQVVCLVRDFRRSSFLKEWGAKLVYGDFKSPETIPLALLGVTAIIDASTARPFDLYNTSQIDLHGKNVLIQAAKKALIKRYIFFSILKLDKQIKVPLVNFKLNIEDKLANSGLKYTIFRLPGFFQGIIGQYALPLLEQKIIWTTEEKTAIPYIDTQDVAKLTIKSLSINEVETTTLPLVGQDAWNSIQIIELCEKLSGRRSKVAYIPIAILNFACQFTNFFQWTWNISDRLAFTQFLCVSDRSNTVTDDLLPVMNVKRKDLNRLDMYLQEYFTKVMKRLKELNYDAKEKTNDQLF